MRDATYAERGMLREALNQYDRLRIVQEATGHYVTQHCIAFFAPKIKLLVRLVAELTCDNIKAYT